MRTVLRTHAEVAQYWATQKQAVGKTKNFFFEGPKIYSWGHHFCCARHIDDKTIVITTYVERSTSTRQHLAYVRGAAEKVGKKLVRCYNPEASAANNAIVAKIDIRDALADAVLPRIHQPRRDASNARAEFLAKQFNEYLAALPPGETTGTKPFPETATELREYFIVQKVMERLKG